MGREIEKATRGIYPLSNVMVRKAKILKAPRYDSSKLFELHGNVDAETGEKVAGTKTFTEGPALESV
jgi:small subunit ribosomal protein S3Ae